MKHNTDLKVNTMKDEKGNFLDTSRPQEKKHNHSGHSWMMILCIGVPAVAFLGVWLFGASIPTVDLLLLLLCPVVMGVMMWAMEHNHGGKQKASPEAINNLELAGSQTGDRSKSSERPSSWEA